MKKRNEKQDKNLQMVEIDHAKFAVELLGENVNVNLTQMAVAYGKKVNDWLRSDEASSYIQAVAETGKCASADLVYVRKGGIPGNQGTWAKDRRIAVRFAQWLDPYFAIMVDDLLVKLLTGKKLVVEPFRDVPALVDNGKPYFNYRQALRAIGLSTRSGAVSKRPVLHAEHFKKFFNQNFITLEFCHELEKRSEERQLVISFPDDLMQDILADVSRIEDKDLRERLITKITGE